MELNAAQADYMLGRYYRRRAIFRGRLGGRCVSCGVDQDLQFDHVDPDSKSFTLAAALGSRSMAVLEAEVEKCQLLCYGCHLVKTKADRALSRRARPR